MVKNVSDLGHNAASVRVRLGYASRRELAELAEVSEGSLAGIENGEPGAGTTNLQKVAKALHVDFPGYCGAYEVSCREAAR